jgi:hypothetical protein
VCEGGCAGPQGGASQGDRAAGLAVTEVAAATQLHQIERGITGKAAAAGAAVVTPSVQVNVPIGSKCSQLLKVRASARAVIDRLVEAVQVLLGP